MRSRAEAIRSAAPRRGPSRHTAGRAGASGPRRARGAADRVHDPFDRCKSGQGTVETGSNRMANFLVDHRAVMRTVVSALAVFLLSGCASQPGTPVETVVARVPTPDLDAPQTVALFERSCLRFTGNTAGLRDWIGSYQLPRVPVAQANAFLNGRAGQVFSASNAAGMRALVSHDNGTCHVIAMASDPSVAGEILLANLRRAGAAVTPVLERAKPDGSSLQQMYRASLGSKRWLLSITAKPHSDAPNIAPELTLMATVNPEEFT